MNSFLASLIDTAFPPRCPSCKEFVVQHGTLCAECWKQLHFIAAPHCATCGHPFEFSLGEGALCAACIAEAPPYAKARAVLKYDEHSRREVAAFKFHDRTSLASMFGQWLARAGGEFLKDADAIVPVPLHWRRLWMRRYNQSALLAHAFSRHAKLPVLVDALKRVKYTTPQIELTRAQRLTNLQGAFQVNPKHEAALDGKSLVLVDDVMTTGATLKACSKALLKAGAKQVYVLTLAKTVVGQ